MGRVALLALLVLATVARADENPDGGCQCNLGVSCYYSLDDCETCDSPFVYLLSLLVVSNVNAAGILGPHPYRCGTDLGAS